VDVEEAEVGVDEASDFHAGFLERGEEREREREKEREKGR
jgi:hypothetical protein